MGKIKFSIDDDNQRKNLFDLCAGIITALIVIGSFFLSPYTSNEAMQRYFHQERQYDSKAN